MTSDEVLQAFRALPLPVRMREAADVLKAAHRRLWGEGITTEESANAALWSAAHLVEQADRWERHDAEKARAEQEVEELAKTLYVGGVGRSANHIATFKWEDAPFQDQWRSTARAVLAAGYRKTDQ